MITVAPVSTSRLDLVPLQVSHAAAMAGVLADPALYAFTGGVPPTEDALRDRYARQLDGPHQPGVQWLNWVLRLRTEDTLVGYVQATVQPDGAAEVAWVIGVGWQGRGLATEAATGLVTWLAAAGADPISAHVHPDHHASAAVAAAAGLVRTDEVVDGELTWRRTRRRTRPRTRRST